MQGGASTRRHCLRIETRLGAEPVERIGQDAKAGGGEPHHGGADEEGEQRPPRAKRQHQHRGDANIDSHRDVDAPLEVPAIGLQKVEIPSRRRRRSEHRSESQEAQHVAHRAEPGQRDIDGDKSGRRDPENPQRIPQQCKRGTRQQNNAGDQPVRCTNG